jgi:hypothetical protein
VDAEVTDWEGMCQLHGKVGGNLGILELQRGDRACTELVGIESSKKAFFQFQQCKMCRCIDASSKIYSYGCWYYSEVVLPHEEDCSFLGECVLPFVSHRMDKRLPQFAYGETVFWFILFGCRFISLASPIMEHFIVMFFYFFIFTSRDVSSDMLWKT